MKFPVLMLFFSGFGLSSVLAAGVLWWRRSARSWQIACLALGGAGLIAGAQYRLARWTPFESEISGEMTALSSRFIAGVILCAGLVMIGAVSRFLSSAPKSGRPITSLIGAGAMLATFVSMGQFIAIQHQLMIPAIPFTALDTTRATVSTNYKKPYQFKPGEGYDWVSRAAPSWTIALASLTGKPDLHYLEIGLYEGRSFFWMAENVLTHPTAQLVGVDPFFDEHYEDSGTKTYRDVFYANLAASGIANRARIIEGFSQIELRRLPLDSFDVIYVDGSHNSRDVLEDAVLSWRLLKDGGFLILDDYALNPGMKRAIDTFAAFFHEDFQVIQAGWQVILKKNNVDRSKPGPWR